MAHKPEQFGAAQGFRPAGTRSTSTNKRREQVADPVKVQRLRPQAVPVDLFVAPLIITEPNTTPLQELAGALKFFGPAVQKFSDERKKKFEDDEIAAGIKAFQENRISYRKAIEQGLIPPQNSPHFQAAFEGQELRLLGKDYELALRTAFAQSPASQSDDPAVFDAFVGEFTKNYMQENTTRFQDSQIVQDFVPEISRAQNILQQRHVEARTKAITDGLLRAAEEEQISILDRGFDDDASANTIGAALQAQLDTNTESGLDRQKANKSLIQNVVNKAIADADPAILDVLNHVETSTGSKLADGKFARGVIRKARTTIALAEDRAYRLATLKETNRKKAATEETLIAAFTLLGEDENADVSEFAAALNSTDPAASSKLLSFSEALKNARHRVRSSPGVIGQLYADLNTSDNPSRLILDHVAGPNPLISSGEAQDAFRYAKLNKAHKGPLRSPQYKEVAKDLFAVIRGGDKHETQKSLAAAIQAKRKLRRSAHSWLAIHTKDGTVDMGAFELFLDSEYDRISTLKVFQDLEITEGIDDVRELVPPTPRPLPPSPRPRGAPNPFDQFDTNEGDDE